MNHFIKGFVIGAALALALAAFPADAKLFCEDGVNYATWYVGQNPAIFDNIGRNHESLQCFATDEELAFINEKYSGIPKISLRSVREVYWDGFAAVFIINNLPGYGP